MPEGVLTIKRSWVQQLLRHVAGLFHVEHHPKLSVRPETWYSKPSEIYP